MPLTRQSTLTGLTLVVLLVLAVASPWTALSAAPVAEKDTADTFERGKTALSQGRYREAIGHFRRVTGSRAGTSELLYWLGMAHWKRGEGGRAIAAYRRAVERDTTEVSDWSLYALENLAEVYTRTNRLPESKGAYERALRRETRPEWVLKIRNQLAELDLAMGDFRPDSRTVFNARGEVVGGVGDGNMRTNENFEIARHTNDPAREAEYYRRAIHTDPGMYQSYFNLGLALTHLGRYREAIPWFEKSDSVWKADAVANPGNIDKTDAHAFLGLCYLELDDLSGVERHIAIAQATGNPNFWLDLYTQRLRIARGEASQAIPALEALRAANPEHAETLHALSQAYNRAGRVRQAREALEAAVASVPDEHPWMLRLREEWVLLLETVGATGR